MVKDFTLLSLCVFLGFAIGFVAIEGITEFNRMKLEHPQQ